MKWMLLALALSAVGEAAAQERFAVGQVWTVKDAPASARFTVMQIDEIEGGTLVHGSPSGFPPIPMGDHVVNLNGSHMPFSEEAVRSSVKTLERSDAPVTEAFRGGYATWEAQNGGVFTITIAQAVEYMKVTVQTGRVH